MPALRTTPNACKSASSLARVTNHLHRSYHPSSTNLRNRLPASYYRGGTSRAVFFKSHDLPKERGQWTSIFLGVLGSPDQYGRQLDGMGGGISSLSKICVVGPPSVDGADIDYTFVAIGVQDSEVDFSGNCGNMISAVGPFAVDSGVFPVNPGIRDKSVTVRIHNTNTGKVIHSTFPVNIDGEFEPRGQFEIDGVSGQASRVQLDFVDPVGSKTGKLLPTGNKIDNIDGHRVSCVDVGTPCCFVLATDLGVDGGLTPYQIEQHPTLLKQLDSIRRQAGVNMGLARLPAEVPGSIPKVCIVSPPTATDKATMDLRVRAISVGQPHKAVPITVSLSTAAASRLQGTVVSECVSGTPVDTDGVTIGHASGTLMVGAKFNETGNLEFATVFRTARRLMEGTIFWK